MVPAGGQSPSAAVPTSALHSLLPHVLRVLRREPAVAITSGYALVAMAGIFYNYWFYRQFGIPVLTLSQIGDFLVAGLQQPMALVLVLSTFPLCWLFDRFNARSRRRHLAERDSLRARGAPGRWAGWRLRFLDWRVSELWYTQLSYVLVIAMYGWVFVGAYANLRANAIKRGEAAQVRVWIAGDAGELAAGLQAGKSATWAYLGAVSNYVFVYDRSDGHAVILPVNAIARIEPVPAAGPR